MGVSSKESKIKFEVIKPLNPEREIVQASQNKTFLDALLTAKIDISHTCGGMGTCGTCRVDVVWGSEKFPERNEIEREFAHERGFAENERLCCQNKVISGVCLKIPYFTKNGLE